MHSGRILALLSVVVALDPLCPISEWRWMHSPFICDVQSFYKNGENGDCSYARITASYGLVHALHIVFASAAFA